MNFVPVCSHFKYYDKVTATSYVIRSLQPHEATYRSFCVQSSSHKRLAVWSILAALLFLLLLPFLPLLRPLRHPYAFALLRPYSPNERRVFWSYLNILIRLMKTFNIIQIPLWESIVAATSAGASECHSQFEQIEIVSDNRSCRPPPKYWCIWGISRAIRNPLYENGFDHMEIGWACIRTTEGLTVTR